MTWIFREFYHLKATKRVYSCIHTKSKAQQSCAATVIFAGVLTVLPKITFGRVYYELLHLIVSVIDKGFNLENLLRPDGDSLG